jgi:hypothetical protein
MPRPSEDSGIGAGRDLRRDVGLSEAEAAALSTSARWSAVGSYSAGISRSVSLN